VSALLGWPIPLTAVQLLVINLGGDSWLSIALATEKAEKDVMDKPPRPADEPVITRYMWFSIALQSVVVTILLSIAILLAGDYAEANNIVDEDKLALQQTAVFITFMIQKILRSAFTARSLNFNLWEIGFFSNRWSLYAAGVTLLLVVLAVYVLPVGMNPEAVQLLPYWFALGLVPPIVEEAVKFIRKQMPDNG
jgi:Ca2+-transporting ATPase